MNDREEELLEVLANRAGKYTSNESSSITYDVARQLMSSILYCIQEDEVDKDIRNKELEGQVAKREKTSAMESFQMGLKAKKDKISKAKDIFDAIKASFDDYNNICYRDTVIEGMCVFFERYDVEFDATNHILTLDYPLLCGDIKLKGIDLIEQYLQKTMLEQTFLSGFDREEIIIVLKSYHKNYEELIINMVELILRNALGGLLVGKNEIVVTQRDRNKIVEDYKEIEIKELEKVLINCLERLLKNKKYDNELLFDYLRKGIKNIAVAIQYGIKHQCLENILVGEKEQVFIDRVYYIEGKEMKDEELRILIEQINQVKVEEKID